MNLKGITLYRGFTPGTIGFDVHGGYGETWTTEYDHAVCYARGPQGYVKKANLPLEAKRLVLVIPDEENGSDYHWAGIAELETITGDRFIRKMLESHYGQLYDIWCEEWTEALIHAGYDSIATLGLEGPEEYVLNPAKLIIG